MYMTYVYICISVSVKMGIIFKFLFIAAHKKPVVG